MIGDVMVWVDVVVVHWEWGNLVQQPNPCELGIEIAIEFDEKFGIVFPPIGYAPVGKLHKVLPRSCYHNQPLINSGKA